MNVIKRDGTKASIDISKIRKQTIPATEGLNLSYEELEFQANISFTENMPTEDVQKVFILAALTMNDIDAPNWTYVAARLNLYDLYHKIKREYGVPKVKGEVYEAITLADYINKSKHLLSYDTTIFDLDLLNSKITPENDKLFNYLGTESLIQRYLLQENNTILELPQHMFMSIAMFLASAEKNHYDEWAIKFYTVMTNLEYLPATPSLANGRKIDGNCMSCAVGSTPDTLEGIFDVFKEQAIGSKNGTGFGWDWSRVRALGGQIKGKSNISGGLIPWLKIDNDVAIAVDQLGVRKGAFAANIETWHKDIFDFLDLKKNGGEDKRIAKELFIDVSCSDIFMRRVVADENWTLFDPYDARELTETWGDEFENIYINLEHQFEINSESFTNEPVIIKAKDLWKKIQKYYWETGNPNLFFKDSVNRKHENPELGIIRSTNLCKEIFQAADENKTILCNLGSINLSKVRTKEDMQRVVPVAMRMLDNVVDLNYYAIPKSEENQRYTRAVGLGICGEAELLATSKIMYGSHEHKKFLHEIYGNLAFISDKASVSLAAEKGSWNGTSPFRNAYRRALAPTSSIAIIMDTTPMHEAVFNRVWNEDNMMGNTKIVAPRMSPETYKYYPNAYDINQITAMDCTAIRQGYFDQGISHNLHFRPGVSGKVVYDTLVHAWKIGVCTTYYMRSDSEQLEGLETKSNEVACIGCSG